MSFQGFENLVGKLLLDASFILQSILSNNREEETKDAAEMLGAAMVSVDNFTKEKLWYVDLGASKHVIGDII